MVFFNIDEPSISVQETEKKVDQGCAGYQARSTVTGAQAKKGRDLERSIGSTPPLYLESRVVREHYRPQNENNELKDTKQFCKATLNANTA